MLSRERSGVRARSVPSAAVEDLHMGNWRPAGVLRRSTDAGYGSTTGRVRFALVFEVRGGGVLAGEHHGGNPPTSGALPMSKKKSRTLFAAALVALAFLPFYL